MYENIKDEVEPEDLEHKMTKKLCKCDDPFPCCYPVGPEGAVCDNCGDWIAMPKANDEGAKRFEEAFETRRPAMSSEETEIAIKVIDRWWSIKELGQEIKQLTQERDEAREDIKRLTEENDKLKAEVRRRHELTEERDEARAALRVRTKERDAALEAIQRMKEANESLKNKNN